MLDFVKRVSDNSYLATCSTTQEAHSALYFYYRRIFLLLSLMILIGFYSLQELPLEVLEERKALIRQLQTQLRNEEMSLVLLKKIRQSQVLAEQAKEAKVSIQPASVSSSRTSQNTHRGTPPLGAGSGSQKVRGSGSTSNTSGAIKNSGVKSVLTPDLSHLKPVSVVSDNFRNLLYVHTFLRKCLKYFCNDIFRLVPLFCSFWVYYPSLDLLLVVLEKDDSF